MRKDLHILEPKDLDSGTKKYMFYPFFSIYMSSGLITLPFYSEFLTHTFPEYIKFHNVCTTLVYG